MQKVSSHFSRIAGVVKRVSGILVLSLLVSAGNLLAGVLVAPTVVFLSEDARTGRMTLQNVGTEPQEVTIFMSFGLPMGDSLGDVRVQLQDSAVTDPKACLEWVKVFPRRLVLPANGTQIVRFVAHPPRDIADGEYWARVVVKSQAANPAIPDAAEGDQITTKLNMVMQTAIMLKYRHGEVFCELELESAKATYADQKIQLLLDTKNNGNASYLGMVNARVVDATGREVATKSVQLAVYRELRRRLTIPIPNGNFRLPYEVKLEITAEGRTDIADEDMLFGNDVNYSAVVE